MQARVPVYACLCARGCGGAQVVDVWVWLLAYLVGVLSLGHLLCMLRRRSLSIQVYVYCLHWRRLLSSIVDYIAVHHASLLLF